MGAGGSTPIAAPFATFATWTAGSCAALVKEYKDKDYDFGIDLPTVEALTGLDNGRPRCFYGCCRGTHGRPRHHRHRRGAHGRARPGRSSHAAPPETTTFNNLVNE